MQMLLMLGNGFDINLRLKTKYSEFYKYYEKQNSIDEKIKKLKEEIKNYPDTWSDFEIAFGKYTQNLNSVEELQFIMEDIIKNLSEYLNEIQKELDSTILDPSVMAHGLIQPEFFLTPRDKGVITEYKSKWNRGNWKINIISLNYTNTFETLLPKNKRVKEIGDNGLGHKVILGEVEHIHGFINERMILGVSEPYQILNKNFHKDLNVHELLVKLIANQVSKQEVDNRCYRMIDQANLITVFGSSLGKTDRYLWKKIGDRLLGNSDCRLILFIKGEEIDKRLANAHWNQERKYRELFIEHLEISEEDKIIIRDKIFIGYNRDIFLVKNNLTS